MTAVVALIRRDALIAGSYRLAFTFDLAWGAVDLLLYYFLSRVVGEGADLDGAPSYFAFAVAGVLVALVVSSATAEIGARIRDEQLTGTLEVLVAQPLAPWRLAAGYAGFPFLFAVARVGLYLLVAALALDLATAGADWVGVGAMLVLSGLAFTGLGIVAAAVTIVVKRGSAVVDAAVFAMTFVSGALFPVSLLPGWLEPLGRVMPTKPAFDGMRAALLAGTGWSDDALVLAGVSAVLLPVSLCVFAAALRHARRRGTISQY